MLLAVFNKGNDWYTDVLDQAEASTSAICIHTFDLQLTACVPVPDKIKGAIQSHHMSGPHGGASHIFKLMSHFEESPGVFKVASLKFYEDSGAFKMNVMTIPSQLGVNNIYKYPCLKVQEDPEAPD